MFAPLKRILFLAAVLMILPVSAFAAATVNNITIFTSQALPNGATFLSIEVNADLGAPGSNNWRSTRLRVDGNDWSCDNVVIYTGPDATGIVRSSDHTGNPLTPGLHDVTVQLYTNTSCGSSNTPQVNTEDETIVVSETADVVNFQVSKQFSPSDLSREVDVSISCTDGHVEPSSGMVSGSQDFTFVVESLDPDDTNNEICTITETPVPGYSTTYRENSSGGFNSSPCEFETDENMGLFNTCEIRNTADPVIYTLVKDWDLIGGGGDLLDTTYRLEIQCDRNITDWASNGSKNGSGAGNFVRWTKTFGVDTTVWVEVTSTGSSEPACRARETINDSSVESTGDCSTELTSIPIGESRSCTITNTVFFEGIPTLNQYGLAIMALLMLGVGFVGFRRFV